MSVFLFLRLFLKQKNRLIYQQSPQTDTNQLPKMQNLRWVVQLFIILTSVLWFSQTLALSDSPPTCSGVDRVALLGFKSSILKDTTGILSSWVGSDCCGAWEGIRCDPRTGRVIALELQAHQDWDSTMVMKGNLSSSLGNLQFLQFFVVSGMKQIRGPIPESISKLKQLTQLYLENNMLEGTVPSSLGQLSSLQALSLSGNRLKGELPLNLGYLKSLLQINLGKNFLTGPIPPTFKNLQNLQNLDLSSNLFSGSIPYFLGQFKNLTYLDLSNNQFSGPIPASLSNLSQLLDLSLNHNRLTGEIPAQIANLKSLSSLSLSNNSLIGPIPDSISKLQNLWYLNLSNNAITDPLPSALAKGIPSLITIDLSYNKLHLVTVPEWIRSRGLTSIRLAGCNLHGTLPIFLKPSYMESIDLSDNYFTGQFGQFFTNMSSLQKLKLSNNLLSFDVSRMVLPEQISVLDLHSNQLSGSISTFINSIRTRTFLEFLDLSNNKIRDGFSEIPAGLGLKRLQLSSNLIAGMIPVSISNLEGLEMLDLSRNQMKGTIPTSLGQLVRLEWLDLSHNGFTGKIPETFVGLASLKHGSFRNNKLCGKIPQERPFNIFPLAAYASNLCLCGTPLPSCKGRGE